MASKYTRERILLGAFDDKSVELDLVLAINGNTYTWHYLIKLGNQEFVRSRVEHMFLKDLIYVIYNDIQRKGLDLYHIKDTEFINKELIPSVENMEYIEFLMEKYEGNEMIQDMIVSAICST